MPDGTTHVDNSADTVVDDTNAIPTIEELQAQILERDGKLAEAIKTNETQATKISGLDSANSKQKNAYDELIKKNESDAERKAREAEESKLVEQTRVDGITQRESDIISRENSLLVKEKAVELNFTTEERESMLKMGINTVEGVEIYRQTLTDLGVKKAEETAKNILDSHSGKPEGYDNKLNNADTAFANRCKA